ncbi:hypothetical protein C8T65DRAFT_745808 [Cerioporus squamosus]|nr:hypothetical protein C8T65DRAFT_745808 [Cerioporus squamosus]
MSSPPVELCVHCGNYVLSSTKAQHERTCIQQIRAAEYAVHRQRTGTVPSAAHPVGMPPTFKVPPAPQRPRAPDSKNSAVPVNIRGPGQGVLTGSHNIRITRSTSYGFPPPPQSSSVPLNYASPPPNYAPPPSRMSVPFVSQEPSHTTPVIPQASRSHMPTSRQGEAAASQANAPAVGEVGSAEHPGAATVASPPDPDTDTDQGAYRTVFHPHSGCTSVDARLDHSVPPQMLDYTHINYEPWRPFATRLDYELAEFMLTTGLNQGDVNTLFDIINHIVADPRQLTVKSYQDVQKAWDLARSKQPAFEAKEFVVEYEHGPKTYKFQHRDAWDWAESLLVDPLMCRHFVWHAYKQFKRINGKWVRFIDEPFTADRLYDLESSLPPDGVPLAFVLYSDKTRLSTFGTQQAYPVIVRLANLPVHLRNSDRHGGGQIVGFLPIVESNETEKHKPQFATHKREVWHEALTYVLKKIAQFSHSGKKVFCGDQIWRRFFPLILICIADYEEQAMMTLIRGVNGLFPCPVCLVPADEQAELGLAPLYPLRTQEQAQSIVMNPNLSDRKKEEKLKAIGVRNVENVFWSVARSNPHDTNCFDRLHAYHSGLFASHLLDQYQKVVQDSGPTAIELVHEQVNAVPRWANLYHPTEVVAFNFADGSKYEALSKVLIPSTYNVLLSIDRCGLPLMRAMRVYCVLDMCSGFEVQTDERIGWLEKSLPRFSDATKLYQRERPQKSWNFPKDHTHQHTPADIRAKGATKHFNTKPNERAHGPVKIIYRERTNYKDVESQISRVEHQFVVGKFTRAAIPLGSLGNDYAAPRTFANLPARLTEFIALFSDPKDPRPTPVFTEQVMVKQWKYIKVDYESMETWLPAVDKLRVTPDWYKKPRYDWVLFRGLKRGEYHFGQLNSVFTCTVKNVIYPLALVTVYDFVYAPRSRVNHELGLVRIRARSPEQYASSTFIHLGSIVRGALVMKDPGLPATYQYQGTPEEKKAYSRLQRRYGIDEECLDAFRRKFYRQGLAPPPFDDALVFDLLDADMFLRLREYFNLDT